MQWDDQIRLGAAYFTGEGRWNSPTALSGLPVATSPQDTQVRGVPFTQCFVYQIGTASTSLASGIFYSASGSATNSSTFTATGPLVSNSVATLDVPRTIRITSSVNLSTTTFTVKGTDGYGQPLTAAWVGPSGDVLGNTGSYTDSLVAFKTASSFTMGTATGVGTTAFLIGSANGFGLPYVLGNKGQGLDGYIDGFSATVPGTFQVAYTPTGTPTASTTDVRGLYTPATTSLPNGVKYYSVMYVAPPVNLTVNTDNKVNSFGATPFTS